MGGKARSVSNSKEWDADADETNVFLPKNLTQYSLKEEHWWETETATVGADFTDLHKQVTEGWNNEIKLPKEVPYNTALYVPHLC